MPGDGGAHLVRVIFARPTRACNVGEEENEYVNPPFLLTAVEHDPLEAGLAGGTDARRMATRCDTKKAASELASKAKRTPADWCTMV